MSPSELLAFTCSPAIQAHLEAHFKTLHLGTKCLATQARQTLTREFDSLIKQTKDPIEKRKLLQALLRATTAAIVPAGTGRANAGQSSTGSSRRAEPQMPRPAGTPCSTYTPQEVGRVVLQSLVNFDSPDEDSALATIAVFAADDCEVNGEPLPVEDEAECVEVLKDCNLLELHRCRFANPVVRPHVIERDHATLFYNATLSHPGTWTTNNQERAIEVKLAKQGSNSVYPSCWLIESITIEAIQKPP